MSTNSVTPDQSTLGGIFSQPTPPNYVSQSSQNPPAEVADPGPVNGPSRLNNVLARIVGQPHVVNASQPSAGSDGVATSPNDADDMSSGQRPGWKSALGKVAQVVSTGLAGVPDKGRPSFITGLGEGARSAQAANATEQAIKFASFNDQVRAANLHAQDLQKQAADDAQQKAQQAGEDFQNEALGTYGGVMETHPNDGTAVMQTLQAQTAANGAASIAPGTHISADGKNINVPANTPQTLAAQVQNYKALEGKLPGLPGLPTFDPSSVKSQSDVTNARAALGQHLDIMQHLVQGYDQSGRPYTHQELNNLIPAYQAQIDSLSKNGGASDYQIGTLKNTLAILQANEQHHSDKEQEVSDQATANAVEKQKQLGADKTANQEDLQNNAAANKAKNAKADSNMYVGSDASGNQVAGTSDDLKAAGAQGVTKLGADDQKKVLTARQLTSPSGLFSLIKQDMLNLDAKGKMGSSATARFNDALLSKAGSDPDYAPLFVHTHLLATALMQAHVGSRGSSDMMDEFKSLANSGKMNAPTLRSALGAEYSYVKEKAMLPKKQPSNGGGQ